MKSFKSFSLAIILFLSSSLICHALILHDFEDGLYNNDGQYIDNQTGYSSHTYNIDTDVKKHGNQSLRVTCAADDNLNPIMSIYRNGIYQYRGYINSMHNAGYDRLSFFIKIPAGYPMSFPGSPSYKDWNFNVGTFSINPDLTEPMGDIYTSNEYHYYHYFTVKGNDTYWTKILLNNHPDWWNLADDLGQPLDPTPEPYNINSAWKYFDGWGRFYMQLAPDNVPAGVTTPMNIWLDDFEVYSILEAENDDHISSIACTYEGSGNFYLSWRGNHMHDIQHPATAGTHQYQVYYATFPLTNSNYSTTGTLVSVNGSNAFKGGLDGDEGGGIYYGVTTGTFSTGITSGTVYFAIKDMSDGSTAVSKIDYPITNLTSDTNSPTSPTGLNVN